MKLSPEQISAGMALIGMKQEQVAEAAGITRAALSRIISGDTEPRAETARKIRLVLENRGVEFLPRSGVQKKDDTLRRLEGEEGPLMLLDDIYYKLHDKKDAEVLFLFADPTLSSPEIIAANDRLRAGKIKLRFVIPEGTPDVGAHKLECRVVSKKYFVNEPVVVYGDYYATTSIIDGTFNAFVFHNPAGAKMFKSLFELAWDNSHMAR